MLVERKRFPDGSEHLFARWSPTDTPRGVVVCVHGIRSHAGWYEDSCRFFAEHGFLTFFLDRRGSGLNREVGPRKVTASLLVDDLGFFLRSVRGEHPGLPVHLVGISWGGKLAVATLLRYPDIADSLTLVAPGIAAKRDVTVSQKLTVLACRVFHPGKMMPIPLNEAELFTANPDRIEYIRRDALSLTECPAALMWASFILDCRVRGAAGNITTPVFMMLAEHDGVVDNEGLKRFYAKLGSMRKQIKVYAGAHHTLEFEPDAGPIFADMTAWFSGIASKEPRS